MFRDLDECVGEGPWGVLGHCVGVCWGMKRLVGCGCGAWQG